MAVPSHFSITHLEMWNILVACRLWGEVWKGHSIHIFCDNMAVVQVLCSGKSKDQSLAVMNRNIWFECATNDIELKVSHIAGKLNTVADMLSRWTNSIAQCKKLLSVIPNPVWCTVRKEHVELDLDI